VLEPEIAYASMPANERWAKEPAPSGYRVVAGDTLARIAHKHRVSVTELCSANGISAKRAIHPGQVLVIPQ
jgi:LysM repeat protein